MTNKEKLNEIGKKIDETYTEMSRLWKELKSLETETQDELKKPTGLKYEKLDYGENYYFVSYNPLVSASYVSDSFADTNRYNIGNYFR